MHTRRTPKSPDTADCEPGEMPEPEVDETLEETFPASDPPSWTLGTDHVRRKPCEDTTSKPKQEE